MVTWTVVVWVDLLGYGKVAVKVAKMVEMSASTKALVMVGESVVLSADLKDECLAVVLV